jgi:hypothetical protein
MSVSVSTQKLELLMGATDAHLHPEAAATAEREPKDSDVRVPWQCEGKHECTYRGVRLRCSIWHRGSAATSAAGLCAMLTCQQRADARMTLEHQSGSGSQRGATLRQTATP